MGLLKCLSSTGPAFCCFYLLCWNNYDFISEWWAGIKISNSLLRIFISPSLACTINTETYLYILYRSTDGCYPILFRSYMQRTGSFSWNTSFALSLSDYILKVAWTPSHFISWFPLSHFFSLSPPLSDQYCLTICLTACSKSCLVFLTMSNRLTQNVGSKSTCTAEQFLLCCLLIKGNTNSTVPASSAGTEDKQSRTFYSKLQVHPPPFSLPTAQMCSSSGTRQSHEWMVCQTCMKWLRIYAQYRTVTVWHETHTSSQSCHCTQSHTKNAAQ